MILSDKKYTFIDIFKLDTEIKSIEIPKIQRDYAQGRQDASTVKIRQRFLDALFHAVTDSPIVLDFIYGDLEEGLFIPLDGQQRLTTLFLLHWYAAVHDDIDFNKYEFLMSFGYDTRYSSRLFCKKLVQFKPQFDSDFNISSQLEDMPWFSLSWKKDPTIASMLVMIDDIHNKFFNVKDLWKQLENGSISFYICPIKDMKLTDDIYVRMNSRGKPLTRFEHFKVELERKLTAYDVKVAKRIMSKIDKEWTDLVWKSLKHKDVDDAFLRYFNFISDVICYKRGMTQFGKPRDEFALIERFFTLSTENDADTLRKSIDTLELLFDCWCSLDTSPMDFETHVFSDTHEVDKIKLHQPELFIDCLTAYLDGTGERTYSLNRMVLLYSVCLYLGNKDSISEEDFKRRIRIVRNLVQNSTDEISDNPNRAGGNRMPEILHQVESIILAGVVPTNTSGLNAYQLGEEKAKLEWTTENPDLGESLYQLEDHEILDGQIAILGLDNQPLFGKFSELFACDWNLVAKALMAKGPCVRMDGNNWRYQLGSPSNKIVCWRNLFHYRSNDRTFNDVMGCLVSLLQSLDEVCDSELYAIIQRYLGETEENHKYEWRYYYIKYDAFRPDSWGKCYWPSFKEMPYKMVVMMTRANISPSSYQPYVFELVDDWDVIESTSDWGISFKGHEIDYSNDTFSLDGREYKINQNQEGIDTEDRIEKGRRLLASVLGNDD